MTGFHLSELAVELNGRVAGSDVLVRSVGTDTRTLRPGDFFVALKGPNFDGHECLGQAEQQSACAAMVSEPVTTSLPCLQVADTRLGLGKLASLWRQRSPARVVAITGSNGKTTVKDMVAAVLSGVGSVVATRGNLNNDIGLPLTLTRLQAEDFAVVELGANHPGEIDYLSRIAQPDVAIVNNAGRAHLEGFGSAEGVARAKLEIANGLSADGVLIYNADDRFADLWRREAAGRRMLSFGTVAGADISSSAAGASIHWGEQEFVNRFQVHTPRGDFPVSLRLAGEHNRMNALAAIAASQLMGAGNDTIRERLATLAPVPGRLCPVPGIAGSRVVDDSYNANPDSVAAAIDVLVRAPGRRVLVLGDLAELGAGAESLHAEVGSYARKAGIDALYTVGETSRAAAVAFGEVNHHFPDIQSLLEMLLPVVGAEESVLIKGSRSARMELVVKALTDTAPGVVAC